MDTQLRRILLAAVLLVCAVAGLLLLTVSVQEIQEPQQHMVKSFNFLDHYNCIIILIIEIILHACRLCY